MPSRAARALLGVAVALAAGAGSAAESESGARPGGGLLAGTRLWGSAYYQLVGADGALAGSRAWNQAQEAGLALNLRSDAGLEGLATFVLPMDLDRDLPARTVVQQLSIRLVPAPSVTVIAGRQRLNWGVGKVFAAIDVLEPRPNPFDVRSILPGVTGVKAVVMPNRWASVTLVALPAAEPRQSRAAARIDAAVEDLGLDLGLAAVKYAYQDRAAPVAGRPAAVSRGALLNDGAWSLDPLVLYEEMELRWGREAGYQFPGMPALEALGGRDRPVFRAVAGAMLQLDLGLTRPAMLVGEYLYNGDGLGPAEARAFDSQLAGWLAAGLPAGAQIPSLFGGIGGLRRHYLAAAVQNLAVQRYLLLSASAVASPDGAFARLSGSLEWIPRQDVSVLLRHEHFAALPDGARHVNELLLIPFRNRVTLAASVSY